MATKKKTTVAVPPATMLKYVLWDGTNPLDSHALGQRLNQLGWHNQVNATDQLAQAPGSAPAVLQPAGVAGTDFSELLYRRGLLEFPRAILGAPLAGDSVGHHGDIVAVSGHGIPGFIFTQSGIPILMSRPLEPEAPPASWKYVTNPTWGAPSPGIVIFSACRQLQGRPQQYYWSQTMRTAPPVHAILGYTNTAPLEGPSAAINRRFFDLLKGGETFVNAWKKAHAGSALSWRWAALCYASAVGDKLPPWLSGGALPSSPSPTDPILYFDQTVPAGRVVTQPTEDLDCWLTPRNSLARDPPYGPIGAGAEADLHIELRNPPAQLRPDDLVQISAVQVRPDYGGPFNIMDLFRIEGDTGLVGLGALTRHRLYHGPGTRAEPFGEDTYTIKLLNFGVTAPDPGGDYRYPSMAEE